MDRNDVLFFLKKAFVKIQGIADIGAICCLILICIGTIFNPFQMSVDQYDIELQVADNAVFQLRRILIVLILLHCFKGKNQILRWVEIVVWIGLFVLAPYYLHQIPSIQQAHTQYGYGLSSFLNAELIQAEYQYYLMLVVLAIVSWSSIPYGKSVLFLLLFWQLAIPQTPELEEIFILSECGEGKCHVAVKEGYVKMYDDHWEYIPKKDRLGAN